MQTANENADGELPCYVEAFVAFEKQLGWFEVWQECNSMHLPMLTKLCNLAIKKILDT